MSKQKGRFQGITGLNYQSTSVVHGTTDKNGEYEYDGLDQDIQWFVGGLFLGQTAAKPQTSIIDLLLKSKTALYKPHVLTKARLLCSLSPEIDMRNGIHVSDSIRAVIAKHSGSVNLESQNLTEIDSVLSTICTELGTIPKTVAHVRNYLRRLATGFTVWRDIKIPVRDAKYVIGDVYVPLDHSQRYPALVSCTTYGKRVVYSGPDVESPEEVAAFELAEDRFHTTNADADILMPNTGPWFGGWTKQRGYETIATFNSYYWVPRGYAMVKIDPQGVGQTPGVRNVPNQETNDFFDAIEWIAEQDWCDGNIASVGNSYGANTQWALGYLRPRGLKAMVPYAGDIDFYREIAYNGGGMGLFKYLEVWIAGVRAASKKWSEAGNWIQDMRDHPFYDEFWEEKRVPVERITLPVFLGASQQAIVHGRGAFEVYRKAASKDKHLQIVDANYYAWPNHATAHTIRSFLDHHLKGVRDVPLERVGMQMRIGNGQWYWRTEDDWPVPGTRYVDWHFHTDGKLSTEQKRESVRKFSFAAEISPPGDHAGVSFISDTFEHDVELAGHLTATVNITSSSDDADIFVLVWALDERDSPVRYGVDKLLVPAASGLLRASRRKLDPVETLPERPFYTYRQEDVQPLIATEVAKLVIEINPMTARVRKGWKLRVDIVPSDCQPSIGYIPSQTFREMDESYHMGAINVLHVGGDFTNKLRVATVPLKDGPCGILWPEDTSWEG